MRLTITGADGFVGRAVVASLLRAGFDPLDLLLVDRSFAAATPCRHMAGDLYDAKLLDAAVADCDALLHLAALPGGAAEENPALSQRINLDVPLRLIEAMQGRRIVMAGSIAIFGGAPAGPVDDDTPARPDSVYGAHKAMVELAFADAVRRGAVRGVILRLPGVVARPTSAAGFGSAWMSDIFHAASQGGPLCLPVTREATSWMASARVTAANLTHALLRGFSLARPITLPALHVRVGDLLDRVAERVAIAQVSHAENPHIQRAFGSYPPLRTPLADGLGFARDASIPALVDTVLGDLAAGQAAPV